eukprot:scaffold99292_cov32-Tisochrysis_lutea.AAC.2
MRHLTISTPTALRPQSPPPLQAGCCIRARQRVALIHFEFDSGQQAKLCLAGGHINDQGQAAHRLSGNAMSPSDELFGAPLSPTRTRPINGPFPARRDAEHSTER